MWRDPDLDRHPDVELQNVPITPGGGPSSVWTRLVRAVWRHLVIFAAVVGITFAVIYDQTTTRLFFTSEASRQSGDPCLTLIWPTERPQIGGVWSTFGHCAGESRDPHRITVVIDLRYGTLFQYQTEPLLLDALPLRLVRLSRNRDGASRAFGKGATLTYDMGLTRDQSRPGVDLVFANGGRFYFGPSSQDGWLQSDEAASRGYEGLEWTGRGWRLHRDDDTAMLFPDSARARRFEQSALLRLQAGDERDLLVLDRDAAGNILRVETGRDRLDLSHDALNRVTAIHDPAAGHRIDFEYDSAGCLVRQAGTGGEFEYDYDRLNGACRPRQTRHDGVTFFLAEYGPDDRITGLTDAAGGRYTFAYQTGTDGTVVRADVRDPAGTLRRVSIDRSGYWFSHWGSYRRE